VDFRRDRADLILTRVLTVSDSALPSAAVAESESAQTREPASKACCREPRCSTAHPGTGIASRANALVSALVVLTAAVMCAGTARADPSQQDQFLALLEQEQIPAIDNVPNLVARAQEICGALSGGTAVEAVVDDEMRGMFDENPALHQYPRRVRKTAVRFVIASVDVYCPSVKRSLGSH
jgi:hypothetical protein